MNGRNIEHFRAMLQNILDSTTGSEDPYKRGIFSVATAVKSDFDRMFPPEVWNTDAGAMRNLAAQYCYADPTLCPICGQLVVQRKGKRGSFLGCSQFPSCRGSRSSDGLTTLNEYLKTFIADKLYEEQIIMESNLGRFQGLDLDDEQ